MRVERFLVCGLMTLVALFAAAASQTDEARLLLEGAEGKTVRGGTWKVVYSSAEGPEGRALEVLTQRLGPILLREGYASTPMVLPLEQVGGEPVVGKANAILIGQPSHHPEIRRRIGPAGIPQGGYVVRVLHEDGHAVVVLAGETPETVLWATFDFLDVQVPLLERKVFGMGSGYPGMFFRKPSFTNEIDYVTAPETKVRSVFSWGHVVDDMNTTFRALAAARFNRVVLWNDQRVVNAEEVVRCAHSWGLQVYWGFSWGWTLSGSDTASVDFGKLADGIIDEWRRKWLPMGGDGVYFQSFTETEKESIGGKSIPEAVVMLVNDVSRRMKAERPNLDIVFGLHSNSMRRPGAAEALVKTDSGIEILWENCGNFPFWEAEGREEEPDIAFCKKILALTPRVGLAWKAQLRMDWSNYVPPAGPFLLGCAGMDVLSRDRRVLAPLHLSYDEDWLLNGEKAHDLLRTLRAGGRPPCELNAVAEYNPPFGFATQSQGELFWSTRDSWREISVRARLRTNNER